MMNKKIIILVSLLFSTSVFASSNNSAATTNIAELFPYAAQSHYKEGKINMNSSTNINGTDNGKLDFSKKDNLNGKCDNRDCTLTKNTALSYNLTWNEHNQWHGQWDEPVLELPSFKTANTGQELVCDYNNNKDTVHTNNVYKNIKVTNKCRISHSGPVIVNDKIEVTGSGVLYLASGDYWLDSLKIDGSGKIVGSQAGPINLYVKDKIEVSTNLGTADSPVNIVHYGKDKLELNNKIKGTLITQAELQMSGSGQLDYLLHAKSLLMSGSAQVSLLPGAHWFDKFDLQGSAKLIQPQAGAIQLHIKENASIKVAALGAADRPVHINDYGNSLDIGGNLTWHGNINSEKKLEVAGSSQLFGQVQVKSLHLSGSGKVTLPKGGYYYKELELEGSSKLLFQDEALSQLHIKEKTSLAGNSHINSNDKPLIIWGYKEDGIKLSGSSTLYGHLYSSGLLEIEGSAGIIGAVNVKHLDLQGSSYINYAELGGVGSDIYYRLDYNTANETFTMQACAASQSDVCQPVSQTIEKLEIHDQNRQILADFPSFSGPSNPSPATPIPAPYLKFILAKAEPNSQELRCFADNKFLPNCILVGKGKGESNTAYVYGSIILNTPPHLENYSFKVKSVEVKHRELGNLKAGESHILKVGDSVSFPLTLTYNQADQVVLNLIASDETGIELDYQFVLNYVPKQLAWVNSSTQCVGEKDGFNYETHHEKCAVLGKAGADTTLAISAYGEGGELIKNYQAEAGNLITINELNAQQKQPEESESKTFDGIKLENGKEEITYLISQVALIQAVIKEHCAPYAIDGQGKCGLPTKGDSQILGRTVPAYLQVTGIAGEIIGGVAYRAKPVEFRLPPLFEVVACAANSNPDTCNELPSYTGEFAKGLGLEDSLIFLVVKDPDNQLEISDASGEVIFDKNSDDEAITGTHTIQLADSYKFVFEKEAPKKAELISQKLKLSINIENDAVLAGEGTTGLAEDAKLRFGYLTVDNTELAVGTNGKMQTRLNYLDEEGKDKEDKNHPYSIAGNNIKSESISDKSTLPNGSTIKAITKEIEVSAPTVWRGKISIEDAPDWLKPYDEVEKGLVAPSGQLTITDRKRGHDRVFNRREAVQ